MLPLPQQNAYRERYKRVRPGWQPSGDQFEALVRRRLKPQSRVLDLGCGRGGVMELFWNDVRLSVGLDPDHASLVQHRAGMPLAEGVGEALPFAGGSFDQVIGLWLLEHLARPEAVLAEVWRVLVPGGHFLFLTPNARHPLILANRMSWAMPAVQRLLIPRLYGRAGADTFRVRYGANTLARLSDLAARLSFGVAELRAIPDPTYLAFTDSLFYLSVLAERLLPSSWGIHILGDFEKQ